MNTSTSRRKNSSSWKALYITALLEADKHRVPRLITQAENAISARAKELLASDGDYTQEQNALGEALYALHALKTCLELHGGFASAA
jgi:hypothetical protein